MDRQYLTSQTDDTDIDRSQCKTVIRGWQPGKHKQQNKHRKGSSLGLVVKAYSMTLALLSVGACSKHGGQTGQIIVSP